MSEQVGGKPSRSAVGLQHSQSRVQQPRQVSAPDGLETSLTGFETMGALPKVNSERSYKSWA